MNFFRFLFGQDGDRTSVPQATVGDGSVSYQQGFGPDYALEQGVDPDAKDIPRNQMNQLFYDLTESARQFQTFGAFPFITAAQNGGSPFPYAKNARALWTDGEVYVSLINANIDPDPSVSPNWVIWVANPTPSRAITAAGTPSFIFGSVAPLGYVRSLGLTIGNTGSGATERANADCAQLFAVIWNNTANVSPYIIQDSGGVNTTRGVSAAADFAAGKRIPLPNDVGRVYRGIPPTGPRTMGSHEEDALQGFKMRRQLFRDSSSPGLNVQSGASGTSDGFMDLLPIDDGTNGTPRIANETRMQNTGYLPITSLGV